MEWKPGFPFQMPIDPKWPRHCMASAVVGFYQTFGIDDQVDVMMI